MRYLLIDEIISLHAMVIAQSGGESGLRDRGALMSAVAQPEMTFGHEDVYPTITDKGAALGYSLIYNHPFVDGNKRLGHAAMEVFLLLNCNEISASADDQEKTILLVAGGQMSSSKFGEWLKQRVVELA